MCGDVEENPGPTVEEMFQTIIYGQQAIGSDIAEIKTRVDKTDSNIKAFCERLVDLEDMVKELQVKACVVDELNASVTSIHGALRSQQAKLVDLEDRSRRSNLVVFGIPEEPNESEAVLQVNCKNCK